jgi:hypothetical protein
MLRPPPKAAKPGKSINHIAWEALKRAARSEDVSVRVGIARDVNTPPEVLYFLASDVDVDVRMAVAANPSTPLQADLALCADAADVVRGNVAIKSAHRMAGLETAPAPGMHLLRVVDRLAADHKSEIRALISKGLAPSNAVPRQLVCQLAADPVTAVSAPMLEWSPVLGDEDLLEILAGRPRSGALAAIARRKNLATAVAAAVAETRDISAIVALVHNATAQITPETLEFIAGEAERLASIHKPLILNSHLPRASALRMTGFVSQPLADLIARRYGQESAPEKTAKPASGLPWDKLARSAERGGVGKPPAVVPTIDASPAAPSKSKPAPARARVGIGRGQPPQKSGTPPAVLRARQLAASSRLDDAAVAKAIEDDDRDFVIAALTIRTGLRASIVEHVLASGRPRLVMALAWRASLRASTAAKLQEITARIQASEILRPKPDSDAYPLASKIMRTELAALAI